MQTTPSPFRQRYPICRILVIGKTGVGKSSLINRAFGIEEARIFHNRRGEADINRSLSSQRSPQYILHDSPGFEPGENANIACVKEFIQARKTCEFLEQLHAVWLCFQIPLEMYGQRVMEGAMQEVVEKRNQLLSHLPSIFVFTKYDMLTELIETKWVDDRKEYTQEDVEKAAAKYIQDHCINPIQRITQERHIPFITVSTKVRYKHKLGELIELTERNVSEYFMRPGRH